MTTDEHTYQRRAIGTYPEAARAVGNGHAATSTLDLIAEGLAALGAAPDLGALALTLARQIGRAALADHVGVWVLDQPAAETLTLAAAWPDRGCGPAAVALPVNEAPLAEDALRRGAALRSRLPAGRGALALPGHQDAPTWVVPLVAGTRRAGVAYAVATRPTAQQEHVGRVLTILGAQAALAATAVTESLAVRHEDADFLAVTAHDLKNVATSIKGYTQLVRRNLPPELAPRAGRWTGIVEQQVGVLTDTLSALVDLGRVQCGRVTLNRQPADLRQIVESAAARLSAGAAALCLSLPSYPVNGQWDAARLERSLRAAFESACRAAPADGPGVEVVVAPAGDEARLCLGPPTLTEGWPTDICWGPGADATFYLLRGFVEVHGGTAGYHRTADGQPLLRLTLPL